MVEQQNEDSGFTPGVRSLYVRKVSRLSFRAAGEFNEALLKVLNNEARERMGQSALFLFSQPQIETLRPASTGYKSSEQRDSKLRKKLDAISTRQFQLARLVGLRTYDHTSSLSLVFNVLLDSDTQMLLHESLEDGLDMRKFGRRAVMAHLWIPDEDIVTTGGEWQIARDAIKQVVWGSDDITEPATQMTPPTEGGARVAGIDWTSRV